MKRMMAEIYGKKTGYCKGKGGSMHIADFSIGMLGADGIVGAGLPIATGAAMAAQLEGKGNVAAVFFGDGACQEGEFHEALNLAAIWKLPLLFVCENNHYGVNTAGYYSLAASEIIRMPEAYHIPNQASTATMWKPSIGRPEKPSPCSGRARARTSWNARPIAGTTFPSDALEDLRRAKRARPGRRRLPGSGVRGQVAGGRAADPRATSNASTRRSWPRWKKPISSRSIAPTPSPQDALEDVYSA